jgi:antitoxin (DNA-binding transcriptional repressor) of toxin-antitoxin stability system
MGVQTLTVTEAARNLSDVINRVYYQGHTFILTRGRVSVARLTPFKVLTGAELARRWPDHPGLTPEDAATWLAELAELRAEMSLPESAEWDS